MTNDETMFEAQMTNEIIERKIVLELGFRTSDFLRHSSFVIRHFDPRLP